MEAAKTIRASSNPSATAVSSDQRTAMPVTISMTSALPMMSPRCWAPWRMASQAGRNAAQSIRPMAPEISTPARAAMATWPIVSPNARQAPASNTLRSSSARRVAAPALSMLSELLRLPAGARPAAAPESSMAPAVADRSRRLSPRAAVASCRAEVAASVSSMPSTAMEPATGTTWSSRTGRMPPRLWIAASQSSSAAPGGGKAPSSGPTKPAPPSSRRARCSRVPASTATSTRGTPRNRDGSGSRMRAMTAPATSTAPGSQSSS